jgi:hypothetical protein
MNEAGDSAATFFWLTVWLRTVSRKILDNATLLVTFTQRCHLLLLENDKLMLYWSWYK